MRGLKDKIIICASIFLFLTASAWIGKSYNISEISDPVIALYLGLAFSFSAGFVAGIAALHVWHCLCLPSLEQREESHAR